MTLAQIAELREAHKGAIAQDINWDQKRGLPVYPENVRLLLVANNYISKLLDEREILLKACKAFVSRAAELNVPFTASEILALQAIQEAESE